MDQAGEVEQHFTVLVRLPFNRGEFVDPPAVAWSAAKERELWSEISKPSRGGDINWKALADQFKVSQQFLLQQAAWLYERQLSQVRAQMRRVGKHSNAPSPVPGSMSGSILGGQAMRRTGSAGSRVPSRLSTRQRDSPITTESEHTVMAKARPFPTRVISGNRMAESPHTQEPLQSTSKRASKESLSQPPKPSAYRRDSEDIPSSPKSSALEESSSESSSSEEEPNVRLRRQPPSRYRRGSQRPLSLAQPDSDDDGAGGDSPPFLPFAAAIPKQHSSTSQDPGATLRGELATRPTTFRRSTSERVTSPDQQLARNPSTGDQLSTIESSATSSSSSNAAIPHRQQPRQGQQMNRQHSMPNRGTLSPRQAATLNAAGLSPRIRRGNTASRDGGASDGTGTPSMGSSFSDLDDTSVTQSALEEALLSNMQRGGNGQGMASRMSTISQALRSRYL